LPRLAPPQFRNVHSPRLSLRKCPEFVPTVGGGVSALHRNLHSNYVAKPLLDMNEVLHVCSVVSYVVGPGVALLAVVRRRLEPSPILYRTNGWRWYVPTFLLPVEWLLPPGLIALRVGELRADWLAVRVLGLVIGVGGAAVLVWASVLLGRFFIHEAAIIRDHALVTCGPYRFIRHPVYSGYLALLLGSGMAALNVWCLLLWPISLLGILIQAGSEDQLLATKFGQDFEWYARRTRQLVPRLWK
jgi:protein-S-isoprenylcysteine O-methyltransferase Ste14